MESGSKVVIVLKKPTLSPSKITTYLACPVKYRWTYIDRKTWYLTAKSYYSFGTSLHRVLERFYDSTDQGVTTTEQALAAFEESWIDAGYQSAEEMAEAFGEGQQMVADHISKVLAKPPLGRVMLTERQLRADLGDFVLLGRIDRVDELPDGTLEIIDYKSGRSTVADHDVQADIAMQCYQLLVAKKFPDATVRATIVALKSGDQASYGMEHAEMAEFEQDLLRLGNDILSEDYGDLIPKLKPLCSRCDFLPLCRKHPEFEESYVAQTFATAKE